MRKILKVLGRICLFVILPSLMGSVLAYWDRGYFAIGGEALLGVFGVIYLLWPQISSVE